VIAASEIGRRYAPRVAEGHDAGNSVARDPKEIVARGYDAIALRYAAWAARVESPALEWLRDLDARLADKSDVLELGCGRGVPVTRELARRHRVTGVDMSAVQIELARHHVPEASFMHADAVELDIAAASFDAIVALYLFGHVPVREQAGLIQRACSWLRPGGHLLATFGAGDAGEDIDSDWLGVPMFFASLGGDAYVPLLREEGLEPLRDEVVVQHEPGHGDIAFRWVLARAA
jgi:SAM-dependent methyltransferase